MYCRNSSAELWHSLYYELLKRVCRMLVTNCATLATPPRTPPST